jgi:hypothetical protein
MHFQGMLEHFSEIEKYRHVLRYFSVWLFCLLVDESGNVVKEKIKAGKAHTPREIGLYRPGSFHNIGFSDNRKRSYYSIQHYIPLLPDEYYTFDSAGQ